MNEIDPTPSGEARQLPPFEAVNPDGKAEILLICDHASNALPPGYGALGLEPAILQRHIAYDIGAADVTRRLAGLIDAPALLTTHSRLFVDANRQSADPAWMPLVSDHIAIPGNQDLSAEEIEIRRRGYYDPYHAAVTAALERFGDKGIVPAVFSIHSFTPIMDGFERPWHVGLLWNLDDRLARPMSQALSAHPGLEVGENQPYSGSDPSGYSIHIHGEAPGIPCVAIEIRQDLIDTHHGAEAWANRLAAAIRETVEAGRPYGLEPRLDWQGALEAAK